MKLYEIDEKINQLLDMQWQNDLPDEDIQDTLDSLLMDRHDKCVNIALYVKNLKEDVEKFKKEEERLNKRRKNMEKQLDWLKNYLTNALQGEKIDNDPRVSVYYNSSKSLVIDENAEIPENYLIPQEPKIDRAGIKKAIEEGTEINGAHIERNQYVVIK